MAPQRLSVLSPPTPVKSKIENRRGQKNCSVHGQTAFFLSAGPREFIDILAGSFLLGRGRGPRLQLDGHTKNAQSTPSVNESLLHRKKQISFTRIYILEESLASWEIFCADGLASLAIYTPPTRRSVVDDRSYIPNNIKRVDFYWVSYFAVCPHNGIKIQMFPGESNFGRNVDGHHRLQRQSQYEQYGNQQQVDNKCAIRQPFQTLARRLTTPI